jgi:eukaryotic-like serine/threonine-protein kinase
MSADPYWENLKEIFHAAIALAPTERRAYLDRACDGNASLRHAVESLLKSHEETGFVDQPAYQAAAEMLMQDRKLAAGQTVGRYRIVSLIGEGGMGRVYLAEDMKLHRKVSLKFLSTSVTQDHERLRRFEQEARAASALNHPNIITIYEIGEAEGHQFIATEFIEGQTLRERLRSPLDLDEALEIATQAAAALVAAHRVNIIHRDIKPENIMIRKDDRLVKVLDFGLAKITVPGRAAIDAEADTQLRNTAPGVVMGTVAYMSPEQARGETVDERTDIWSLAVVLYEMVAGCSPFVAGTSNEIVSAILSKQTAPPLARYVPSVPERLGEIVEKALAKNRDERYQTSKDLLIDLKRLQQTLQLKAASERSTSPDRIVSATADGQANVARSETTPAITQSTSSAEYIVNQVKKHNRVVLTGLTLLLLIAAGVFIYIWRARQNAAPAQLEIKSLAVLPLKSFDPGENYLGLGIADAVILRISQTGMVIVRPTSAIRRYLNEETDGLTAAKQLGVDSVLEGSVQSANDRLRVSVNLLRTSDGASLWSDTFESPSGDIFTVQDTISQQVASRLQLKLNPEQQARLGKRYTSNPEAYEYYSKGLFFWNKRTKEAYRKAIEFFNQALEKDPEYALAYAGLAGLYTQGDYPLPPKERMPLARQSALKAIELDNTLAEPHTALGRVKQEYDWDWEGAEKEFKLAIELDSNSSLAHMRYNGFLTNLGKHEEAIAEGKKAVALDPLSPLMNWSLEFDLYWARRYDEAIEQAHKTLEIDPSFMRSYYTIGDSYERKGMYEQAVEWYLKGANLSGSTAEVMAWKEAYAAAGVRGYYRKRLDLRMVQVGEDLSRQSLYNVAALYSQLAEKEKTFEWLHKAFEERPYGLMFLKIDPAFDNMRSDPRFVELMKRVGLVR